MFGVFFGSDFCSFPLCWSTARSHLTGELNWGWRNDASSDMLLPGCTRGLGISLLQSWIFVPCAESFLRSTVLTSVHRTRVLVREHKPNPQLHSSSCVNHRGNIQPPLCLVLVQTLSAMRGNSPIRQTEGTIPAFQSSFPKYFLMRGTRPLREPDKCPVYLSSWTLQEEVGDVLASPGPRRRGITPRRLLK